MKHRDLLEEIRKLEFEIKCDNLNGAFWTAEAISKMAWQKWRESERDRKAEPLDRAYDPPLTQMDIDPDFQG